MATKRTGDDMNRERAKELRDVFNAFAEGKEIESRVIGDVCWGSNFFDSGPTWKDSCQYRIKPEPREFWVCWKGSEYPEDPNNSRWFPSPKFDDFVANWDNAIKVREVL